MRPSFFDILRIDSQVHGSKEQVKEAERRRDREIREKQESIQTLSVFLPPIPLLIVAIFVYRKKKAAEILGASSSRVRS